MKFPTDRPVKVVMLGAGGTGGYVAPYVFRLLHMLDRPARFVVCDGDTLKLIPGTPEENAPVFDFENERILRPAA